jgi:hypothetical protein
MTNKQVRIMFYDEQQKSWVVDTMEVAEEGDKEESLSEENDDSPTHHAMAYF